MHVAVGPPDPVRLAAASMNKIIALCLLGVVALVCLELAHSARLDIRKDDPSVISDRRKDSLDSEDKRKVRRRRDTDPDPSSSESDDKRKRRDTDPDPSSSESDDPEDDTNERLVKRSYSIHSLLPNHRSRVRRDGDTCAGAISGYGNLQTDSSCLSTYTGGCKKPSICLKPSPDLISIDTLTDDERKLVLDKHNDYRRTTASSADIMMKLVWDDKLAANAKGWASQCTFRHDGNLMREDPDHYPVGQNLAWTDGNHDRKPWDWVVWYWYDEVDCFQLGTGCITASANPSDDIKKKCKDAMCGHYTQVVDTNSYKIGCAYAKCKTGGNIYACDYGPAGNMCGYKAPYKARPAGSSGLNCQNTDSGLCTCPPDDCGYFQVKNYTTCVCRDAVDSDYAC